MPRIRTARSYSCGLSLVELIIGLCLFAVVIIPLFGIIPMSYLCIKKAEDFATASLYAQEIVNIYRMEDPQLDLPYRNVKFDVALNNTEYHVSTELYGRDNNPPYRLVDIIVTLYWKRIPEKTSLCTRINYAK